MLKTQRRNDHTTWCFLISLEKSLIRPEMAVFFDNNLHKKPEKGVSQSM